METNASLNDGAALLGNRTYVRLLRGADAQNWPIVSNVTSNPTMTSWYYDDVIAAAVAVNESSTAGAAAGEAEHRVYISSVLHAVVTCVVLGAIILAAIVGNVFVIAAIVLERNLQNVANYLIASLAVADLMVAVLVMPLAAVKEVTDQWLLGKEACDMFVSCDVLCCTSSILHLVAISVDRYWAVTRVDYIHNRPVRLIGVMIGLSWGISTVISIPPLFGWRDPAEGEAARGSYASSSSTGGECVISQNWGYTVYSTLGAFYIPLAVMLVIYMNVYRAARGRIRRRHFRSQQSSTSSSILAKRAAGSSSVTKGGRQKLNSCSTPPSIVDSPSTPSSVLTTTFPPSSSSSWNNNGLTTPPPPVAPRTNPGRRRPEEEQSRRGGGDDDDVIGHTADGRDASAVTTSLMTSSSSPLDSNGSRRQQQHWLDKDNDNNDDDDDNESTAYPSSSSAAAASQQLDASFQSTERRVREKREQARERKAARTLAIITGSFVVCWLPFFVLALVGPFCGAACSVPPLVVSVIGWLGYFNSLLNPVIYTIFNPDFRSAFRKILFGSYRNRKSLLSGRAAGGLGGSLAESRKFAS